MFVLFGLRRKCRTKFNREFNQLVQHIWTDSDTSLFSNFEAMSFLNCRSYVIFKLQLLSQPGSNLA